MSVAAKIRKMIITLSLSLFIGYALFVAFVYFRQGSMLYYPLREIEATPRDIGLQFEELTLKTKDGVSISAWFVPAESERGVLLFCHGNAGNISHRLDSIRIFHALKLSVLIFDYRGYGRSEGVPTERGTYLDADAAWDYLVGERHIKQEKIIIFGRSLGSAVAAETALRNTAGALILESGFTSVPDLGARFFPYLPVRMISRYQYATKDKVRMIKVPKLIIHSPQDEIIPYEQGIALYEGAAEPKEFLQISGGHNEGFLASGALYFEGLHRFVAKYL